MYQILLIAVLLSSAHQTLAFDEKSHSDQINSYRERIQLPSITSLPDDLKRALQAIQTTIHSKEFKQKQRVYENSLSGDVNLEVEGSPMKKPLKSNIHLVLFISSSIPEITLKRYARDLAKTGGVMVLRGGIDGIKKISPTLKFIHNTLKKDSHCKGFKDCELFNTQIIIDPKLFIENNIERVPALAYLPKITLDTYCEDKSKAHNITANTIVYGDASLTGLLEELIKEDSDQALKALKKKLTDVI